MKKLLSILFMLIFIFCLVSCDSSNNKPNNDKDDEIIDNIEDEEKEEDEEDPLITKTYKVKFVDENGKVLGVKRVSKNTTFKDPGYGIEGYDTIAWLYNGIPWDFENDIVESDIVLVLKARKHIHEFVFGECSCGFKSPYNIIPNLTESELKELTATVTFWHAFGMNTQVILDEIIFEFNKIYPNITIEHSSQGSYSDLRDKIMKSMRIGQTPTIAQAYPEHISLYLQGNMGNEYRGSRALDQFINHPIYGLTREQLNDFNSNSLIPCKSFDYNGTFYSLPFLRSTEVLYFNATWFKNHGLLEKFDLGSIEYINDTPTFVRNEGATLTWEDIEWIGKYYVSTPEYNSLSMSEKLENYVLSYDDEDCLFITLTQQWGGGYTKLTGVNQGEFVFNNQESKSMVEWYKNAFEAGYFVTASAWGDPDAYSSDKFVNGQIKMNIATSAGSQYNDPNGRFVVGILPFPQRENGNYKYATLYGTDLTLFHSETALEELAGWLFIKFLTTWTEGLPIEKQPAYMWSTRTRYFPVLSSVRNSLEYNNFLQEGTLNAISQKIAWEQREYFYAPPSFIGSSNCRDEVENLIEAVLYAGMSIESAYNNALNQLQ